MKMTFHFTNWGLIYRTIESFTIYKFLPYFEVVKVFFLLTHKGMWAHILSCQDYQDLLDRGWRRLVYY